MMARCDYCGRGGGHLVEYDVTTDGRRAGSAVLHEDCAPRWKRARDLGILTPAASGASPRPPPQPNGHNAFASVAEPPRPKSRDVNDALREGGLDVVRQMSDAAKPAEPPRNAAKNAQAPTIKTAALLQGVTFAPLKYIVPGLIVEGLILLAGRPKVKKSWLALDVALAIAAKRACLGDRMPEPGDVLYLALEDGERRLQQRMTKLLPTFGGKWPDRFHYATQWPRADQGGVEEIEKWGEKHPNARLVVIDVFARFRAPTTNRQNAYEQDYAALSKLQELATRRRIAIVIVHHTRKGGSDDPVEEISGTLGLAGAADGFLVLKRTNSGATLIGRCRDTEDVDLAVQFSRETCRWTILGAAADVQRSEQRGQVLLALEEAGKAGLSPKELADVVAGLNHPNAKQVARRMANASEIQSDGRGRYFHPTVTLSPVSPRHRSKKKPSKSAD
jgi:AAA domain